MSTRRRFLQASALLAATPLARGGDRLTGLPFATRSEVIARHGAAATSQPLATQAAIGILRRGGSAVDAAIAANAVLGLVEPTGSGIGGDLFAIVWEAGAKLLHGLNGSGRSPRALTLEHLQRQGKVIPPYGPLPVTVPGCVDGWFTLHERFGRLPMRDVLEPAIGYATEGFHLSQTIAWLWERGCSVLKDFPGFAPIYMPAGRAPRKGERFRNPFLAATLATIARDGRDAFYRAEIATRIATYMREQGGFLSEADLAAHRSEWVEPVSTSYRGVELWELPPNGQGIAALQMLNILEGFDLAAAGFGSARALHWMVEAKKLAFEDRARWYADPAFAKVPVEWLVSKEYAAERRALIREDAAATRVLPGAPRPGADTVYLTVADRERNMVSLIQSNYRGMGSGMTPHGLGFVLHDRGEMFSLDPAHPNAFAPGKRPFHTIIPAFVTEQGQPWMSYGVMGGD
ncbi:MAG: gamma-glutamyltransferase family protein, partial [Planctomycetota bacterium]